MTLADWTGASGVFLILGAYILNISGVLKTNRLPFKMLNLIGASLACLASVLLDYIPFIILEATWALASLAAILLPVKKRKKRY
ncbi:CBU_0592 family membrane protein [Robiginitalea sp. IMCC43444]|uniref:CBU_0592 family membrane protein n=1 Tax=Robiginitalea sp. IMCC43444 TaxID=3459121 RepID=UPI004042A3A1